MEFLETTVEPSFKQIGDDNVGDVAVFKQPEVIMRKQASGKYTFDYSPDYG